MKALFCPECGSALENDHCPNPSCIKNSNPKKSGGTKNVLREKNRNFKETGKKIVPDCIEPDLDEYPIKQYDIARLQTLIKGAVAEGRLQVTNKRVLFRATGNSLLGPTSLQYEFGLEEIAGIEIRKEARFNFLATFLLLIVSFFIWGFLEPAFAPIYNRKFIGAVFSLIVAAASVVSFFALKNKRTLRHMILSVFLAAIPAKDVAIGMLFGSKIGIDALWIVVVGAYIISLLYLAFAPNLVVNIKTKGGTPSVEIRCKDGIFSLQHNEYTGFSQVLPGPDTDLAMRELGALIREVQQNGTYRRSDS